jgi:hypothetical protein
MLSQYAVYWYTAFPLEKAAFRGKKFYIRRSRCARHLLAAD